MASSSQAPRATSTHGDEPAHERPCRAPLGTSREVKAESTGLGRAQLRDTADEEDGGAGEDGEQQGARHTGIVTQPVLQCGHDDDVGGPPGPPVASARWRATLRKQPSAFLLAVQILVILLLPVLEDSDWGRAVISLLSLSAVITAVFTVRSTPALTWLSVTLALPAAVFEIWSLFDDRSNILVLAHCALAVFYFYTAYALISYMFEDYWVTKDELFAVGACFTVLVFAFAYIYLAIQEVWPGSFTVVRRAGASAPSWSCSTTPAPCSPASA